MPRTKRGEFPGRATLPLGMIPEPSRGSISIWMTRARLHWRVVIGCGSGKVGHVWRL